MSKTASSSFCLFQNFCNFPLHRFVRSNYHLANPFPVLYCEIFVRQVNQNHPYFSPVICINRPRGIQYCNPFFECQPATWTNLRFVSMG